jgi:hypothetical protein
MKGLVLTVVLAGVCSAAFAEQRTVIVPKDDKPFTVAQSDLVRLTGRGIAGAKIGIDVDGAAKVATTSIIREVKNGGPLIGALVKEFQLQPTGPGNVKATITVTPPQPGAQPKTSVYAFKVK